MKAWKSRLLIIFLSLLSARVLAAPTTPAKAVGAKAEAKDRSTTTPRWLYLATNLQVDENLQKAQDVLRRGKAAGYNGVVLADYKLNILDRVPENYFQNARAFRQTARDLGIGVYPAVCPMGYSNGLLAHDPNLAEGLPVRDAPFIVKAGEAQLDASQSARLQNGDFESAQQDKLSGWNYQDAIGTGTFVDRAQKHGGTSSLRIENIGKANAESGNGRVNQSVPVARWRHYHLSVWIKTDGFETPGNVRGMALLPGGRMLSHVQWDVKPTQDWTQYQATFNSMDTDHVLIYFGVWGGRGGKIWFDDAQIEEAGLVNVLRRPGCPLVVKGEDGTTFEESRDFLPVRDEKLGQIPWAGEYEVWHDAPAIKLTVNSRIHDGQKLRVSFYHPVSIYGSQVAACLSDPKVFDIMRDQLKRVHELLQPDGYMMSHDEIRLANWCETCQAKHLSAGKLLAANVARCVQLIRREDAGKPIFVWSDMFDPHHNAVTDYYLVNGSLVDSWDGLPKSVTVLNWNFDKRADSLKWFDSRGHKQIIAGYYDGDPKSIHPWLDAAKTTVAAPRAPVGIMYTTWQNRYEELENFAREAWGETKPEMK
jgi:hypothetical protein